MSDQEPHEKELEGEEAIEAAEHEAETEEQGLLSRLQAERDELESKLLRVSADYQNFARRAQQNVDSAVEQKIMDMARSLVTVMDHFDRALEGTLEELRVRLEAAEDGEHAPLIEAWRAHQNESVSWLRRVCFGLESDEAADIIRSHPLDAEL